MLEPGGTMLGHVLGVCVKVCSIKSTLDAFFKLYVS